MAAKRTSLVKADYFYIKGHYKQQSVEEIADTLNVTLGLVKAEVDRLRQAEPSANMSKPLSSKGTTQMTREASEQADDFRKVASIGKKKAESKSDHIHIMDKSKPIS